MSCLVRAPAPAPAACSRSGPQHTPFHTARTANRKDEPMLAKKVTTLDVALGLPMVNGAYGSASGGGAGVGDGSSTGDELSDSCS